MNGAVIGCIVQEGMEVPTTGKWADMLYRFHPDHRTYPIWPRGSCGHAVNRPVAEYVANHDLKFYQVSFSLSLSLSLSLFHSQSLSLSGAVVLSHTHTLPFSLSLSISLSISLPLPLPLPPHFARVKIFRLVYGCTNLPSTCGGSIRGLSILRTSALKMSRMHVQIRRCG